MIEQSISLLQSFAAMLPELLLQGLVVSTLAIALVLLIRRPWRHAFGPQHAPLLWALVPACLLALLIPASAATESTSTVLAWLPAQTGANLAAAAPLAVSDNASTVWLWGVWAVGGLAFCVLLVAQQRRFYRRLGRLQTRSDGSYLATSAEAGPAVIGLWRPRVVLPADFEQRFSAEQQAMILCHERSHAQRGDVPANAIASALRCIYWFNPLVHYAADRLRHDHELAADAAVIAQFPQQRKCYAETLLKVQLAVPGLPVGCLWQSSHPLKERIAMLKANPSSKTRQLFALAIASSLVVATAGTVWAAKPAEPKATTATPTTRQLPDYAALLELTIDGESSSPILGFSKNSGFVIESAGWRLQGNYQPNRAADDLQIEVHYQGKAISVQRYEIDLGTTFTLNANTTSPESHLSLSGRLEKFDPKLVSAAADKAPTYRSLKPPRYPQSAIDAGVSGWVLLRARIGADGQVREVDVEKAEPQGVFDEVAVTAAKDWSFEPAVEQGSPVEQWVQLPICFSLVEDEGCQVPPQALDTIRLRAPSPNS